MKKKNRILSYLLILMGVLFFLTFSCKKEDENNPTIQFNPDLTYGTMTDQDGNTYKTITIGTQTWMAENLKTTKYRNGDPIPNITDDTEWANLASGAYCDYGNSPGYSATYGRLYNRYAVNDSRNIAPTGWHIPSDAEWTILTSFLGGEEVAGGKLKEKGIFPGTTQFIAHWYGPNAGATNESGFTALPGGYRHSFGYYHLIGARGYWWSSTEYSNTNACVHMGAQGSDVYPFNSKGNGFSVRCLKD